MKYDYWQANRATLPERWPPTSVRNWVVWLRNTLCDLGYSVSGVYGISPQSATACLGYQGFAMSWGTTDSQHTHCYAGEGGNPSPVDACWNSESSCWSGTVDLPGAGYNRWHHRFSNGTIMSYCHQLQGRQQHISYLR